jgi:[ribosomal protein S5]-alanine N-acetyltransferase
MTAPIPWFPIHTQRLSLRPFEERDLEDTHAYGSDPNVARYMPWGPNTPEETRTFLTRVIAQQSELPRLEFGFAVEHSASGRVIGSAALHLRDGPNRTAELGYCLAAAHWRQGYISEAARALLDAAFGPLDLHRVFATCDTRNTGSFGVMEKIGMRREGELLLDRQVKGEWRDTYIYAVLAREWAASAQSGRTSDSASASPAR